MTAGIVLCGGRSTRMGRAKAWLPWRGQPMVAHVVDTLAAAVDEVVVVSSETLELPPLDARIVRDRDPALGPLAGIREGLDCIESKLAFVTSTDAPFLTPRFVHAMLSFRGAAALELDGFVQTLGAVFPREGRTEADKLLAEGARRPLDLLERLVFRRVAAGEVPDVESVRGFNTPAEYLEAAREANPQPVATLELLGRAGLAAEAREFPVPIGTLAEVLAHAPACLELLEGDRVAKPFLVCLDGRAFARDARIPIGPGERVVVLDASVGG